MYIYIYISIYIYIYMYIYVYMYTSIWNRKTLAQYEYHIYIGKY